MRFPSIQLAPKILYEEVPVQQTVEQVDGIPEVQVVEDEDSDVEFDDSEEEGEDTEMAAIEEGRRNPGRRTTRRA